jgi:hypothetical protein
MDRVPASGSCIRCQRALGLASLKQAGLWYCSPLCAEGDAPDAAPAERTVAEAALYARPRRHFRSRAPKELRASSVCRTSAGGAGAAGTH